MARNAYPTEILLLFCWGAAGDNQKSSIYLFAAAAFFAFPCIGYAAAAEADYLCI